MDIPNTELRKVYEALKSAEESNVIAKMDGKEAENKLKEEFASAKGFYKKDGTTLDLSKVKIAIVKSAIEVKETGINALEEKLSLQDEYLTDIKNGTITKGFVDAYVAKQRLIKETSETAKDVKENMKTTMDSDVVEAIHLIVKNDVAEANADDSKPKKDNSEVMSLVQEIKKKLGL